MQTREQLTTEEVKPFSPLRPRRKTSEEGKIKSSPQGTQSAINFGSPIFDFGLKGKIKLVSLFHHGGSSEETL